MIEKATELGVAAIVPVETARSERGLDMGRGSAWSDGGGSPSWVGSARSETASR